MTPLTASSPEGARTPALGEESPSRIGREIVLRGEAGHDVPAKLVDVGSGSPVVFLHGLVGLNEHWEDVVERAKQRLRCVMLEIPLLALEGEDCSIQGVTTLTVRFLEEHLRASGSPVVLVGNSFGGHVALRIALERPDLVRGLVLAGSSGLIEKSMVSDVQIRPSRAWLERKIAELFYDKAKVRDADVDRAYRELSRRGGARAMVKLSRSARRNHMGDNLGQIKLPTLLIWGKDDIVTPPEAAHGFMAKLPNASIVWFDRCGHAPMIECPDEFAAALQSFEQRLAGRGDAS